MSDEFLQALNEPVDEEVLRKKLAARQKHTCVKQMSSLVCSACNRGVPYPHLTVAEFVFLMRKADR